MCGSQTRRFQRSGRRDTGVAGIQSCGECRWGCNPPGLIYERSHQRLFTHCISEPRAPSRRRPAGSTAGTPQPPPPPSLPARTSGTSPLPLTCTFSRKPDFCSVESRHTVVLPPPSLQPRSPGPGSSAPVHSRMFTSR